MQDFKQRLKLWLEAEESGFEGRSEAALSSLFELLPDSAPSSAMVEKVLIEIGVSSSRDLSRLLSWLVRAALAASLLLVASSVLWLPTTGLAFSLPLGRLAGGAVDAILALAGWLGAAVSLWRLLAAVGEMAALVLATPQALLGLGVATSVGLVAFYGLCNLTFRNRSSVYVDPS